MNIFMLLYLVATSIFNAMIILVFVSFMHEITHLATLKTILRKKGIGTRNTFIKIGRINNGLGCQVGEEKDYLPLSLKEKNKVLINGILVGWLYILVFIVYFNNAFGALIAHVIYSFACIPDINKYLRNLKLIHLQK